MQQVLQLLETRDSVQVTELAEAFSVSEVTVRSDLTELAQQGLVARVRGGVRALQQGQSEVGFDLRLRLEVERKRAIARAAAAMVGEGEAVALDASTTAYYLALELRAKRELVVVTNGLLVATALADAPGITVLVTGGMLRLSAMSLVGDLGTDVLRTTRINKGFLGARGLSLERGLMDLNPDEVRIKQEMADACEQVYGILDGTKWHRSALLSFVADRASSTGIVTDSSAPADEVEAWRAAGVDVITVDPGPREPPPRPAARPAPRGPQRRSGSADGDAWPPSTSAPRAAASRVGRFDGERLDASTRCTGSRTCRSARRARCTGTSLRLYARRARRAARGRARRGASTRSPSTPGPSTSGCSTRSGRLLAEPGPLPRRAPRRGASSGVLARVPAARALRAHRDPAAADQHDLRARRDGGRATTRRSTARRPLLLIPDLFHHWLCGSSDDRAHERDDDAVLRPARRAPGRPTCSSGSTSRPSCFPRSSRRARRSAASPPTSPTRPGSAAPTWSRSRRTTPAPPSPPCRSREPGSAFLSVGTWSLVGVEVDEPLITDDDVRREPDERGRRRRHVPAAAQRHRPLAAARVPPRLGARRAASYSFDELVALAAVGAAAPVARRPERRALFAEPGDMPARDRRRSARATGQAAPDDAGAIVRCILESLALKHARDGRPARARSRASTPRELHVVGGGARNELLCRWTAEAAGLPVLAGPEEATLRRQPARAGDGARRARRRSTRRARSCARSFAPTIYEPRADAGWDEARERFAALVAGRRSR